MRNLILSVRLFLLATTALTGAGGCGFGQLLGDLAGGVVQVAEIAVAVGASVVELTGIAVVNVVEQGDLWTVRGTDGDGAVVVDSTMALEGTLPTPQCSDAQDRFDAAVVAYAQCHDGCEDARLRMHLVATEVKRCR